MKKLLLFILVVLFFSATINAQTIVPNSAMQGQSLQTTITLATGTMISATGPMGYQDIYLQQGANIIYTNMSYQLMTDWYNSWDPWSGTYVYTDSGLATFDIPSNAASGFYDVVVNYYPFPWAGASTVTMTSAFYIGVPAGTIQGSVYFDLNQNGVKDINEPPMSNSEVQFSPSNARALTNLLGEFIYFVDTGTYTTSYNLLPGFTQTSTPLTYTATIPPSVTGQDFGTFSASYAYDHDLIINRSRGRCNTDALLQIRLQNGGILPTQSRVTLITSSNYIYLSSTDAPSNISGDTLTWNTPVINPTTAYTLGGTLIFTVPAALQTVSMTVIDSLFDTLGNFIDVYTDTWTYEVRCSYDPNDKHVNPIGVLAQNYTPIASELTYLINFQNTGNDTAYDVFIFDTLNVNLDPATFELAGSSHIVNTQLTPNGEIRFNFFNIMLPDSGADLEGSKGWVLFRVNPDASLPDPTEITNTAHIVFDQNSPIVTNTTLNTMTALQYPQSGFNTADVSICETDCIFYNNQSASGTSYNWSFPGGSPSSSTAASPGAICYSTTGSYDVTLITTNALGSDTLTQASYINVAVSPVIFSVVQLGDTLIAPQGYASYQWYYNNVAIANDTLYYHVATQNGDYGVIVSNPNGCESGVNIPGVITGIEDDLSALNNLEVYPNPSTGAFEISFLSQGVQKVKIEFYDNVGRVIEANTILSTNGLNKFAFNSYELSSGIYTLKLTDNSKSVTKIVLIK